MATMIVASPEEEPEPESDMPHRQITVLVALLPPAVTGVYFIIFPMVEKYLSGKPETMIIPLVLGVFILPVSSAIFALPYWSVILPSCYLLTRLTRSIWAGLLYSAAVAALGTYLVDVAHLLPNRPSVFHPHRLLILTVPLLILATLGFYLLAQNARPYYEAHVLPNRRLQTLVGRIGLAAIILHVALMLSWSVEPALFNVAEEARQRRTNGATSRRSTGYVTTSTLLSVAETLLSKHGGYLRNDIFPPGVWLGSMRSWEAGVLIQVRAMATILRSSFAQGAKRGPSHPDLAQANFYVDAKSWIRPSAEQTLQAHVNALNRYLLRLGDSDLGDTKFTLRHDQLRNWLRSVKGHLKRMSQRLRTAPESRAVNDRPTSAHHTGLPYLSTDNVYYGIRGECWALVHFLRAVEIDFQSILTEMNAHASLRRMIDLLEQTQHRVWPPILKNHDDIAKLAAQVEEAHEAVSALHATLRRATRTWRYRDRIDARRKVKPAP